MKKKRDTPEQIIRKLREADGLLSARKTIAEVCQQLEICELILHRRWNRCGDIKADNAKHRRSWRRRTTDSRR